MSTSSDQRSADFLQTADQFKLGALTTESSHPITAELDATARRDLPAALGLLFDVDADVLRTFRQFVQSGRAEPIRDCVVQSLARGGQLFFTGCGSTGRLSIQLVSIWRGFWQEQRAQGVPDAEGWEQRAHSVMAGGDFALIKAVEGFEDFTAFGRKQIADLGVRASDVVFAITEGGETSFVIGTAWQGVAAGAKVFFVYNNPDEVLCQHVQRSREVIEDSRIEKLNLTTGPMAISGSTRMQATTIQLCVLLTVLEMVVGELANRSPQPGPDRADAQGVPARFLQHLETMQATLGSPALRTQLARLVALEEGVYRAGRQNNYFADRFGMDVLTDTTERSPTYCTPPFRKFDDPAATPSWAFLFLPEAQTPRAWERLLKRPPRCLDWAAAELEGLVPTEKLPHTRELLGRIRTQELLRFRIGQDGLPTRQPAPGDSAVGIVSEREEAALFTPEGFLRRQLDAAQAAGARTGLIFVGSEAACTAARRWVAQWQPQCVAVCLPMPETQLLLDGVTRAGLKMLLNALSTATMVRLGRVMGNTMIWVVASNLKLIDRATRYIQRLSGLEYPAANRLLFEVVEYIEPRMKADQAYPPVVGLAVLRARHGLDNAAAERRLAADLLAV
jgi:N-acetylmuramic acid 6-phosphate etherase